jgi:FixJ family two-component response regulator
VAHSTDLLSTPRGGQIAPLPARLARSEAMSMASGKPPRPLARPLVCIVDDDISFREALEGWIGSLGFATRAFGSAEDFLADDDPGAVHCLLLDIQMSGLSGLELQDQLVAAGVAIPTVFITSRSEPRHRARALAAGAIGFLSKPFDRDVLMSIFDSIAPSRA